MGNVGQETGGWGPVTCQIAGFQIEDGGTIGGTRRFHKPRRLDFIGFSDHHSIDPSSTRCKGSAICRALFLAFGTEALFKGEEGIQAIGEQMRVDGKR